MKHSDQWKEHSARLGPRIKQLREAQSISLTRLAEAAGVSKSYLHELENNGNAVPGLFIALSLAGALGTSVEVLAGVSESGEVNAAPGTALEIVKLRRKLTRIRNICSDGECEA